MTSAADGFAGFAAPNDQGADINAQALLIERILAGAHTATIVRVMAVSGSTVDAQPLVHQVDGAGQVQPHGTVHGMPFVRWQGGTAAVILDPVAGDIGLAVFASRDISGVKATGAASPPGSGRRNSMSDGIYLGGLLNAAPTTFIRLGPDGITLTTPLAVTINADTFAINAVRVTHNGTDVGSDHRHIQVQPGQGLSGVPVQNGG